MSTIQELSVLREKEDHIEFKEAAHNYPFAGGQHTDPKNRRHCVLGYIVALANERGGRIVLGMTDKIPHKVVGSDFASGETGALEDEIYKRLHIRVRTEELFDEAQKRVLVINVPSRPIGKALRFEGVPLMRIGESLREMDDAEYFSIISEQSPDFSATICNGLTIDDLSGPAIANLRNRIYQKQNNPNILTMPERQLLTDLNLMNAEGKLTYAALILLGKSEIINKHLPQNNIVVEYRPNHTQIRHTARQEFRAPLVIAIDEVWDYINQPASNPMQHIEIMPQIMDIPSFNSETIREALLNAMMHRSFQMGGDIFIRQYPDEITICNSGGFPYGVNLDNLLTINSSPRNRLLTEVVEKTGLIERSGQGVDIMFRNCLMEGKALPDYSASDDYQVQLSISATVIAPYLALLIREFQQSHGIDQQLNVFDMLTLYSIANHTESHFYPHSTDKLLNEGLISPDAYFQFVLSDTYFKYYPPVASNLFKASDIRRVYYLLQHEGKISMADFQQAFLGEYSPKQVRNLVDKLFENGIIEREGKGKATHYKWAKHEIWKI